MKRLLFTLCMLSMLCLPLVAQTIGTGDIGFNTPMFPYHYNFYSQNIYLQEDIDITEPWITKIAFQWLGGTYISNNLPVTIYMGETAENSFADDDALIPIANMTLVYTGSLTFADNTAGWKIITLTTPFEFSNTSNLVVGLYKATSAISSSDANDTATTQRFAGTETAGINRSLVYASTNTTFTPATASTITGADRHLIEGYANIQLIGGNYISIETPIPPDWSRPNNTGGVDNVNPHHSEWDFAYSQFIYLQNQINKPFEIGKIALQWNGGSDGSSNDHYEIFMAHTNLSEFASFTLGASSWLQEDQFTPVFAGIINISETAGWIEIELDTPFTYNNTQNLVISFNEVATEFMTPDNGWFWGTLTPMRGLRQQRNGTPYNITDATSQPTTTSPSAQNIGGYPHVRLYISDIPDIDEDLQPVENLSVEVTFQTTNGTVSLDWDAPDSTTLGTLRGYRVYRNQMLMTPTMITETEYTQANVLTGTYYYHVTAVYTTNVIASAPVTATVAPPAVTDLAVDVSVNTVALTWEAPTLGSVTGYKVYRGETLLTPTAVTSLFYDDLSAPVGTHTYSVVAVYPFGESLPITIEAVVVGPLFAVTGLDFTIDDDDVVLSWLAPNSISVLGYKVYCDETPLFTDPITETSYTDEDVADGTYTYGVTAVYSIGESTVEEIVVIKPIPEQRLPVTNLTTEVIGRNVLLTWNAPVSATVRGYKVYRDETLLTSDPITDTEYTDTNVPVGSYVYGVKAVYDSGDSEIAETSSIPVSQADAVTAPQSTMLMGNYPNPFNPSTAITFDIAKTTPVTIDIYNLKGQLVKVFSSDVYPAGRHAVTWNGLDDAGHPVSSGIYFYRMQTEEYTAIRKMLLLK